MSKEEKGLDYYLAHPEEADQTDTKLMAQLLAATGDPATATTEKVSTEAKSDDSKATEDAAKVAVDEKAKLDAEAKATDAKLKDEDAAGVATKDGKHVIPFSVLESERQQRATAEADAVTARKEAAEAKAQLEQALKDKGVVVKTAAVGEPSTLADLDAAIEEVKDEAPWMVPALEKMRGLLAASDARAQKAEDEIAAFHQAATADANKAVGDAIANNPALTVWMSQAAEKPALWQEAIDFDNKLRANPDWANKPVSERLNKVAELVASVHGKSVLPPGYDPSSVEKPAAVPPGISAAKAKEIADKALKDAPSAAVTLSDIPGGEAVETDPMDIAEKASIESMGNMFMNMTPAKQAAWLSKHT